jgi:hypothetical protein
VAHAATRHHRVVWWKREPPARGESLLREMAGWIMRIDAKVDQVIELLEDELGEEEEDA